MRLQRVGLDLQLVLEAVDAPVAARPAARNAVSPAPPPPSATDLAWMLDDLAEVLDRHPSARSVFPALVLVERALGRRLGQALERLPEAVRRDAVELLERLDAAGTQHGLALLKARLRDLDPTPWSAPASAAVQVQEASLTLFMEADREWDRQFEHVAKR